MRPVWFRENVSERSLPIHYNLKKSKWRGNVKEGLSFYSIYGDNPEQVVGKYRSIQTKRATLKSAENTLKRNTEAVRQAELAVAQERLTAQRAATAARKANLREAERIEREARANVRGTQTLGERFRGMFSRGGKRKTRRSGRKTRRVNTRRNRK